MALRYLGFQAPGWLVAGALGWLAATRTGLNPWIVASAVAIWIGKDLVLFPFVWRAYLPGGLGAEDGRVGAGALGTARAGFADQGYVAVGGELWRAERAAGSPPVAGGDAVRVVGREGLTLYVEKVEAPGR